MKLQVFMFLFFVTSYCSLHPTFTVQMNEVQPHHKNEHLKSVKISLRHFTSKCYKHKMYS